MRKRAFCLRSITIAIMAAGVFLALSDCRAQSQHELNAGETDSLERFLRNYLKNEYVGNDLTTRYSAALVKLTNGNEPDVIVYITGRTWCGSGGCKMLVLVPERASYEVVTETTVTRLPIRLLATMSHGWHDIGVWVQGGGIAVPDTRLTPVRWEDLSQKESNYCTGPASRGEIGRRSCAARNGRREAAILKLVNPVRDVGWLLTEGYATC